MTSRFLRLILVLYVFINSLNYISANDQFEFNVTEIEITNNGNLIVGSKNGTAKTEDGFEIIAETFVYNKLTNILNASGNVKLFDKKKK